MNKDLRKRLINALIFAFLVIVTGTVGFHLLLDRVSLIDSLYLTIVTVATVGYGDISPHNNMPPDGNPYVVEGFAIILIILGMATIAYAVSVVTEYVVSGEMGRNRRKVLMLRKISRLRNHFIICGAGETGAHILDELEKTFRPCVVIDKDGDRIDELSQRYKQLHYVTGDATSDKNLTAAGLTAASGIAAALPDEKDNLFIVFSAAQRKHEAGERFRIVAKVRDYERTAPKLREAGADMVIGPESIAGRRMVSEMLRPAATTFLDRMLHDNRAIMRVEEARISTDSILCGKTLLNARIPARTGLLIIALRRNGEFRCNPDAATELHADDVLVALGPMHKILSLRKLATGYSR